MNKDVWRTQKPDNKFFIFIDTSNKAHLVLNEQGTLIFKYLLLSALLILIKKKPLSPDPLFFNLNISSFHLSNEIIELKKLIIVKTTLELPFHT